MRPQGTYGEVRQALARAAEQAPGTVREIAQRAQVAYGTGRYTASRMLEQGELVVLHHGRPAVVAAPGAAPRVPDAYLRGHALAAELTPL